MKKVFFIFFFILYFCNSALAESYYFKECKISEKLYGDYIIDFNNNKIEVNLKSTDGATQKLLDKIKSISKDQIVSDLLQSRSGKNKYFQYYLEVESKSVIKQNYELTVFIFSKQECHVTTFQQNNLFVHGQQVIKTHRRLGQNCY